MAERLLGFKKLRVISPWLVSGQLGEGNERNTAQFPTESLCLRKQRLRNRRNTTECVHKLKVKQKIGVH